MCVTVWGEGVGIVCVSVRRFNGSLIWDLFISFSVLSWLFSAAPPC